MKLISREKVLYIDDQCMLSYRKGRIFYHYSSKNINIKIGNFLNKFSLVERALRLEPKCATRIDEKQFIISFDGKVLNYNVGNNTLEIEHNYDKGMKNPTHFTSIQTDKDPIILYGEYIWNINKGPVRIYMRTNGKWERVYTFSPNTITHIHNIIYDKYRNGYIVLTGDEDKESGIWFADAKFKKMRPIVIGKQQYRSCVAFPVEDGIIYATDTPLEQNYIFKIRISESYDVIEIVQEYKLPGPCIYGTEICGDIYFSTSVEPDSTLPAWRYRITHKLGKGVNSRYVHIIKNNKNFGYSDIFKAKKDYFPMWLFQFGNIQFPENRTNRCIFTTQSINSGHGITIELDD